MSIPAAIVSAAFVTVVELVGSVLVLAGALITIVAACYMIVMVGAAVFVHIPNGIFAADNGWELVGAIAALLLVLAAAGPGRWSVDHAVRARQSSDLALDPVLPSSPTSAPTSAPPPQVTTSATDSPSSTPTMAAVPAPPGPPTRSRSIGKGPRRNRYQLAAGLEKPVMPHSAGDVRAIRQIRWRVGCARDSTADPADVVPTAKVCTGGRRLSSISDQDNVAEDDRERADRLISVRAVLDLEVQVRSQGVP
jgi:hypothetical protein